MPFRPEQFVFQPRPLQAFDISSAFRDLADRKLRSKDIDNRDRQATESLGEQRAQRGDTNSYNAATFAKDRVNSEYEADAKTYAQKAKLVAQARDALQRHDMATAAALGPSILELGGIYDDSNPDNIIVEAGQAPNRGNLNVQGTRSEIYGGGNGPSMGSPFSMPSPSSMFNGSSPFGPRDNPGDVIPGASAAMTTPAAPPPVASPVANPQDAATQTMAGNTETDIGGPQDELEGAPVPPPPDAPEETEEEAPPNPANATTNPFETPTFNPYSINMSEVTKRNQLQLDPLLRGMEQGASGTFRDNVRGFNRGIRGLGMPPEDTMKLAQPMFNEMAGMYRGDRAADAAGARLGLSAQNAEFQHDDKLRRMAQGRADRVAASDNLKKTKEKLAATRDVESYLDKAITNPNVANELIGALYRMNNVGVMNDKDYDHTRDGVKTILSRVKDRTMEAFFKERGGLNPDTVRDMREFLDIAGRNHRVTMKAAATKLEALYRSASTETERMEYENSFRSYFDQEYWPQEMQDPYEGPIPEGADIEDGDLGTSPTFSRLDGGTRIPAKVSPNGVPLVKGSRVPAKKPKDVRKLSDEQLDEASEDELMEMLRGASGAN